MRGHPTRKASRLQQAKKAPAPKGGRSGGGKARAPDEHAGKARNRCELSRFLVVPHAKREPEQHTHRDEQQRSGAHVEELSAAEVRPGDGVALQ